VGSPNPLPSSDAWSDSEESWFNFLSNIALDMIKNGESELIPFQLQKRQKLWQNQNLTMQLLLDDISRLLDYYETV